MFESFIEKAEAKKEDYFFKRLTEILGSRDLALFLNAKYTKEEILWIGGIKLSVKDTLKRRPYLDVKDSTAYDLIRAHAMLGRDLGKLGYDIISKETEKLLDDLICYIVSTHFSFLKESPIGVITEEEKKDYFYNGLMEEIFKEYKEIYNGVNTDFSVAKRKALLLTKWLTYVHSGGNMAMLSWFHGIPEPVGEYATFRSIQAARLRFLNKLNSLGTNKIEQSQKK